MVRITSLNVCVAAVLVAFVVSGCQSNKFMTAWKERSKPKSQIQGLEGPEEVTYWPYKIDKSNKKMSPMPDQLKEKLARRSEPEKRDSQLTDLMKEGDQLSANGQFEDARLVYTRALLSSPGNPLVHHRLAVVADKQHQYSAADEHYQAALRARPRDVNVLSDLGYSYALRGNLPQAEQTLKQALDIDHSHRRAMANLGAVYAKQNRRAEALAMFRERVSEVESQQLMTTIFAQDSLGSGATAIASATPSNAGPAMAATNVKRPQDLSGLNFDQIQSEMAREAQEAKRKRYEADQRELLQARNVQKLNDEWTGQPAPRRIVSSNQTEQHPNQMGGYVARADVHEASLAQNNVPVMENQTQNLAGVTLYPSTTGPASESAFQNQNDQMSNAQPSAAPFVIDRGHSSLAQSQKSRQLSPLVQQARGQQAFANGYNGTRSVPASDNASQLATQLGMSAGPGSLFPVVDSSDQPAALGNPPPVNPTTGNPLFANPSNGNPQVVTPATGSSSMLAPTSSYDTRFGGEFQQAQSYQNPNNFSGNQIQQTADRSISTPAQNDRIEAAPSAAPSIAPASPAANWGSPSNWQGGSSELPSWANQQPTSGAAGTGVDTGAGQSVWAQNSDRRVNTTSVPDLNNQTSNRGDQSAADSSHPYSGTWPANANSLPNRSQSKVLINGRSSNGFENSFGAPQGQTGGPMQNGSTGAVPQWPYTPR